MKVIDDRKYGAVNKTHVSAASQRAFQMRKYELRNPEEKWRATLKKAKIPEMEHT